MGNASSHHANTPTTFRQLWPALMQRNSGECSGHLGQNSWILADAGAPPHAHAHHNGLLVGSAPAASAKPAAHCAVAPQNPAALAPTGVCSPPRQQATPNLWAQLVPPGSPDTRARFCKTLPIVAGLWCGLPINVLSLLRTRLQNLNSTRCGTARHRPAGCDVSCPAFPSCQPSLLLLLTSGPHPARPTPGVTPAANRPMLAACAARPTR